MSNEDELITEARRIIKVDSKGNKRRRIKCKRGFKLTPEGKSCVPITGSERANKKKSIRKALRTKRSKGVGYTKRTTKKRLKAMRKRKGMGIK